ncbi:TetR/AcrR family transcriptional regulator [Rapidithrix thailandica]|uniref:TetR/AcrR family transcriptional regulator n=1 Tax=Rapidithrix thailandica TaxID=413964 RepID=A0AAW9SGZ0_9BACT
MKKEDKVSTREKILHIATALFHKQGYNATGINQVIAEAKVAKASLYYHFPTKDDLCIAYLKERHRKWEQDFRAFLRDKPNKVIAAFDAIIDDNLKNDFRGCSFLNMLSETPPQKTKIFEALQYHKLELQKFFASELEDSELAYQVYSLFENAIMESQLFRSQAPVLRLQKIVVSLLDKHQG